MATFPIPGARVTQYSCRAAGISSSRLEEVTATHTVNLFAVTFATQAIFTAKRGINYKDPGRSSITTSCGLLFWIRKQRKILAPSKSILLAFAVLGVAVNSSLGAALPSTEGGCVASLLHHAGIPTTHSVQYELALAKSGVSFPQVSLFPPNILSALGVTDPGYASTLFSCVHGGKCASYHHCSKRGR